jgi:hypothetical protein
MMMMMIIVNFFLRNEIAQSCAAHDGQGCYLRSHLSGALMIR